MRSPADVVRTLRRRAFQPRLQSFSAARPLVAGRIGLEFGGPSSLFARGGSMPLYGVAGGIDNCNFSRTTVWQGAVEEGHTFTYDRRRPPGRQFIQEATDPREIATGSYAF